jgi:serine/threonine protein kinase
VQHAHAKGVLHLDLKPANIVLQAFGQVSVIDWGLAQFHDIEAYRAFPRECKETDYRGWEGDHGGRG